MSEVWTATAAERGALADDLANLTPAELPDAVREMIDFYKGSNMVIGSKNRVAGLALSATDHDWQHGDGEAVEGPLRSLLLAMTGRAAACDTLAGPGVPSLRGRCAPAP
jgi:hypothetical protein